jgi:hypothetical protein
VAREIEVLSVRVTREIEVLSVHVAREIELLSVHVAREIEVLVRAKVRVSYCNNYTNTLTTLERSEQCDLLATSRPCLYGNVGVVLRGACREGRRVGEGWRGESFNQRQLRTFLCSVAKCNWKAFKYW